MDEMIKQRLVGALVLVALMVIFLPMIFDEDQARQAELLELPPRPDIPRLDLERPVPPSWAAGSQQNITPTEEAEVPVEVQPTPIVSEVTESQASVSEVPDSTIPQGWTLQLASFQDPTNAEALRDKLRDAGFKAYIQQRPGSQPQMLRVMIGPELKREEMEQIKTQVNKAFKIEGIVVEFEP